MAVCGSDGKWEFRSETNCSSVSCRSLEDHLASVLPGWQSAMAVYRRLNFTASAQADAVLFRCKAGRVGRPLASCLEGRWQLDGGCEMGSCSVTGAAAQQWIRVSLVALLLCLGALAWYVVWRARRSRSQAVPLSPLPLLSGMGGSQPPTTQELSPLERS